MSKVIGYVFAIAGLAIIALSKVITSLPFISSLGAKALLYTILAAVVLLVIGIVLAMDNSVSKSKSVPLASEEVPIYQGEGKNKKIVGYKKAEK